MNQVYVENNFYSSGEVTTSDEENKPFTSRIADALLDVPVKLIDGLINQISGSNTIAMIIIFIAAICLGIALSITFSRLLLWATILLSLLSLLYYVKLIIFNHEKITIHLFIQQILLFFTMLFLNSRVTTITANYVDHTNINFTNFPTTKIQIKPYCYQLLNSIGSNFKYWYDVALPIFKGNNITIQTVSPFIISVIIFIALILSLFLMAERRSAKWPSTVGVFFLSFITIFGIFIIS